MKNKLLTICIFLFGGITISQAQPEESVLLERYGAIRAEMLKQACEIANMKDSAMLKLITNSSLQAFKAKVKNDTIKAITAGIKPLSGNDIIKYVGSLRESRRHIVITLGRYYPEKEEAIDKQFLLYLQKIEDVTNELTNKPVAKKDSTRNNPIDNKTEVNPNLQKEEKNDGSFSGVLIMLLLVAILIAIYIRRRHHSKITNNTSPFNMSAKQLTKEKSVPSLPTAEETKMEQILPVSEIEKKEEANIEVEENILEEAKDETNVGEKDEKTVEVEDSSQGAPDKEESEFLDINTNKIKPEEGKAFALDVDDWILVGASVQGNGHIKMNMPCQDNHGYEYLYDGWGIAVTSDGAGSARLSHVGSAAVVARTLVHFKALVEKKEWKKYNILPSDIEWMKDSYRTLKTIHDEVAALAKHNECEPQDLNATVIVVIHTPMGLLVVHVGDGRAGYRDMKNNWHKLITPHKGEEANQTIFLESGFWNRQFFEMSGVSVPESFVLREPVSAFTLMSDGCESTSWLCNQFNEETGKYYDPNMPYDKFFNSLTETLQSFRDNKTPLNEREEKWYNFIKEGNKAFIKETDDKTMILATLYQPAET